MPEGNKKLYMWLWVIGITIIIGAVWIASVKYNISTAILSIKSENKTQKMQQLKADLQKEIDEMKQVLDEPMPEKTTSTLNSQEH